MKHFFRNITKKISIFSKTNMANQEQDKEILDVIDIDGILKNRYSISSYGKIVDMESNQEIDINYRNRVGRVLLLDENMKYKEFCINRLLAVTFIPKTSKDEMYKRNIVHVKDWNSRNHNINNLVWANSSELYIYVEYEKKERRDSDDEILYISMLLRRNYNFDDILEILPFKTTMSDIVSIYGDMKI